MKCNMYQYININVIYVECNLLKKTNINNICKQCTNKINNKMIKIIFNKLNYKIKITQKNRKKARINKIIHKKNKQLPINVLIVIKHLLQKLNQICTFKVHINNINISVKYVANYFLHNKYQKPIKEFRKDK